MNEKLTGVVTKVDTKTGEKNGKPWRRAAYTINGQMYSTFDTDIISSVSEGSEIEMEFTTTEDGKYRNIKYVKVIKEGTPNTNVANVANMVNGTQVSEPVEYKPDINLGIVRQSSIKSAIEMIKALQLVDPEKAKELVKDNNIIDIVLDTSTALEEFICRTKTK